MTTIEIVTPEEMRALLEWRGQAEKRQKEQGMMMNEWAPTNKAVQISGVSSSALVTERDRPGGPAFSLSISGKGQGWEDTTQPLASDSIR